MSNSSMRLLRVSRSSRGRHIYSAIRRPIVQQGLPRSQRAASSTASEASAVASQLKNLVYGTSLSLALAFAYLYVTDTRAGVHQWLAVPSLRWLYPDAEDAHHVGTKVLKALHMYGLHPRERAGTSDGKGSRSANLQTTVFGQELDNPIGTSAGIDKLAEIPDALFALGPAIVEVGGATPYPQDGNPKPRVFRLPSQRGLINRYGLNSLGADDMAMRLRERVRLFAFHNGIGLDEDAEQFVLNGKAGVPPGSLIDGKLLAVQVAKNKFTKDEDIEAVRDDYVYCVERLAPYADILVVNVSSPNTPGLRTLQRVEPLTKILEGVVGAARAVKRTTAPKVMVKVSPDEDQDEQIAGIVEAVWRSGVDGVIVGNTTKRRNLEPRGGDFSARERQTLEEVGGYSGPQMFERTLSLVKRYRTLLDKGPPPPQNPPESLQGDNSSDAKQSTSEEQPGIAKLAEKVLPLTKSSEEPKVIFATGGITNGKQALEILNTGASVAQIYTALVYGGVGTVSRIKKEMREEIRKL